MAKIFICYRREDSAYPAHQIYEKLTNHFGADSVVFDVDTIPLGKDFREYLNNQVSECDVLLAIIGDQWIKLLQQRLDDPKDFVQIEIQAALERDIAIVPILVGRASVPGEKDLPEDLAGLAYRNAAEVRAGRDLPAHLKRLVKDLDFLVAEINAEAEKKGRLAEAERNRKAEERINRESEVRKRLKQKEKPKREAVPKTYTNSIGMKFVLIPSGSFKMGSRSGDSYEEPQHEVNISHGFYLQTTQVTQGQWQNVMGSNHSMFKDGGKDGPVEFISWYDAQEFINKLNEGEGMGKYRLPTEAEWEYACRAGTATEFAFGDDKRQLGEYAWYRKNSEGKTHPVGQKKPNAWGLYDMHGNVWEWVEDDWHDDYQGAPNDGRAWIGEPRGDDRVIRGGGFGRDARYCRSAYRGYDSPVNRFNIIGFRLARSVEP